MASPEGHGIAEQPPPRQSNKVEDVEDDLGRDDYGLELPLHADPDRLY